MSSQRSDKLAEQPSLEAMKRRLAEAFSVPDDAYVLLSVDDIRRRLLARDLKGP